MMENLWIYFRVNSSTKLMGKSITHLWTNMLEALLNLHQIRNMYFEKSIRSLIWFYIRWTWCKLERHRAMVASAETWKYSKHISWSHNFTHFLLHLLSWQKYHFCLPFFVPTLVFYGLRTSGCKEYNKRCGMYLLRTIKPKISPKT